MADPRLRFVVAFCLKLLLSEENSGTKYLNVLDFFSFAQYGSVR